MKNHFWRLFVVLLLPFLFVALGCDNTGDNDRAGDNDNGADDDNDTDDDDSVIDDDTTDDDTGGDDDNNDDDDDDDDDTVIIEGEPVAVLTADTHFADVGDEVSFDGGGSFDPNGSPLTFVLDYGDGDSTDANSGTHAYVAPGLYRAVLTATNDDSQTDQSSWLVTIGNLPTGVGNLNEIDFLPAYYDSRIHEKDDNPNPDGGLVTGYFISLVTATPDTILINGVAGIPENGVVNWCEVIGGEVYENELAVVRCQSDNAAFNAGTALTIEVSAGATSIWSWSGAIPAPALSPSFITVSMDGGSVYIYVRNDANQTLTLTGLEIDGVDFTTFVAIDNPVLAPNQNGIIQIPYPDRVETGVLHAFSVIGTDGKAEVRRTRSLQLFLPVVAFGAWTDDIKDDPNSIDVFRNAGVNMFIYNPTNWPPEQAFAQAEEQDFYLFTHINSTEQWWIDFVNAYADEPRYVLNAVFGEPDIGGDPPLTSLQRIQQQRDIFQGRKPLWGYNACAHLFDNWANMGDYGGMDHYCVWAPKCNTNFPPFYWDYIEFVGWYTDVIKRNAEPKPIWNWSQAVSNVFDIGQIHGRCTSADEIRSQFYENWGHGMKGMNWYNFSLDWDATCTDPEGKAEMGKLTKEIYQTPEIFAEGETFVLDTVATSRDEKLDIQAIVAPHGMAIVVVNLDYVLNLLLPFVWNPRSNLTIDVTPPPGYEPAAFTLLDGDSGTALTWEKIGANKWRVHVPLLAVAGVIHVEWEP